MRAVLLLFLFCSIWSSVSFAKESYARIITSAGTIKIRFLTSTAPKTVDNFIKLSKGEQRFVDKEGKKAMRPFYNGLVIHRAHPELGIFSGCQWGTGRGWPGYYLFDEIHDGVTFDAPGKVAMAKLSASDNRFGSQFFITTTAAPRLNKKYTIFAEVESGMDVVKKIASTPTDAMMMPKSPITINSIEVFEQ